MIINRERHEFLNLLTELLDGKNFMKIWKSDFPGCINKL